MFDLEMLVRYLPAGLAAILTAIAGLIGLRFRGREVRQSEGAALRAELREAYDEARREAEDQRLEIRKLTHGQKELALANTLLERKVDKLEAALAGERAENMAQQDEINALRATNAAQSETIRDLQGQVAAQQEEINALRAQLNP